MAENNQVPSAEDMVSSMIDFIHEYIKTIHSKDPKAVELIDKHRDEFNEMQQNLLDELENQDELTQDDFIEMSALNLLISASLGIPEENE